MGREEKREGRGRKWPEWRGGEGKKGGGKKGVRGREG